MKNNSLLSSFLICPLFCSLFPYLPLSITSFFLVALLSQEQNSYISFIFLSNTMNPWSIQLLVITPSLALRKEFHIFIYSSMNTHFYWSFHLALSNLIATFHLGTKEDITQTWLLKLTKSISKNTLDKMPSSFLYKKEESDLIIHFQQ